MSITKMSRRRVPQRHDGRDRGTRSRRRRGNFLNFVRLPFVDYARGDGIALGPGEDRSWDEPALLHPLPEWASNYRGLWGLYARDPVSGENAPAGPVYRRDGQVRRSWYDPVSWAGVLATIAIASLAAAWRPALEAARVDPVKLLKEE